MAEDASRLMAEENPSCGVERREQDKEADVEPPQALAKRAQRASDARKLREQDGEHAGAHGRGEPVGRELAHHLERPVQA